MDVNFQLASDYQPQGDQGPAIEKLVKSIEQGNRHQTLLGVTGSGKTFTMANVIARINKPTLVISHNKTLAAQLYSEFKSFFPNNAVEYFVSYFDYYQPEAYIPRSDTYIEKDSAVNEEIERHRLSAMGALLTRKDVLVVASVSCIYGLGSPDDYQNMMVPVHVGMELERDEFLRRLVDMLFERNDISFERGKFRVRGDVVDVHPAESENEAVRVEFFGDEIDRISIFDPLTGNVLQRVESYTFSPAKQFVTSAEKMKKAAVSIRKELDERVAWFEKNQKFLEAQRIRQRTEYDLEMMKEMGFCQGIENYSRHLTFREPGARPYTLLDFFQGDFLTLIDESHASVPQIGGMYEGDRSRKSVLVEHGFRLPSAMDNRPLRFEEFMEMSNRLLYVTATPGPFELLNSRVGQTGYLPVSKSQVPPNERDGFEPPLFKVEHAGLRGSGADVPVEQFNVRTPGMPLVVEQIIRPTGLVDPEVEIKPLRGQIDETMALCRDRILRGERVLVTTLTKRTAEDLTDYLVDLDFRVRYIHADVDAIERVEILRSLRAGECDVLIGINLLREGLDLPEVSLVCVLDADKEGYLRSATSLIQTAGRAARHVNGRVVLFADQVTGSMQQLLDATAYRRARQLEHNEKHGIVPQSVKRGDQKSLQLYRTDDTPDPRVADSEGEQNASREDVMQVIADLQSEMREASVALEFERAALLRDQIAELKSSYQIKD
ncbi:excinuclease ABC subunit UvrB [Sulfuriroseicoccus oceanibius]|uniref:UvrABC system protein B n=1 Tax=Sulfuriroseicoccus oceanibius TaxID=2707525 RepID=A0A6B3LAR5_9BACT|nr:excinuclease ABC subunit UvrB [Sulfuriroseicoccus oceanibius]QQL45194.1 excinuclease ABC subunit UvrB [Sulfuriroseicoccus oceanibius]